MHIDPKQFDNWMRIEESVSVLLSKSKVHDLAKVKLKGSNVTMDKTVLSEMKLLGVQTDFAFSLTL